MSAAATQDLDVPVAVTNQDDQDPQETREWLDSLQAVVSESGRERASFLLRRLAEQAQQRGLPFNYATNTPYVNTIPVEDQPPYPGDRVMERRIRSIIRWNAMAMVVRGNHRYPGIGGHISTFASSATVVGIAVSHFIRGKTADSPGDQVYFQGHAAPGIYARAFLEGRVTLEQLENFRRELGKGGGLSSYPHPWLMPNFWEFPTVSMGLAPLMSIYQARFNRYLQDRGIADTEQSRVWAFLGDGETDEPESLGALTLASREGLNNLVWVVNCNLQRLDGPVRGNGKIIQELEAAFRGAGWNVIKVIWGSAWDPLFAADEDGLLVQRLGEVVDGQFQKYVVEPGSYVRQDLFGVHPKLEALVSHLTDEDLKNLNRGGHDPVKLYAAYQRAVESKDRPTVVLAQTIKGYGLGESGEGRNVSHNAKKLEEKDMREFRDRFGIPVTDEQLQETPFYHPGPNSPEVKYLLEHRRNLGGFVPQRKVLAQPLTAPPLDLFKDVLHPSDKERDAATTQSFGRILRTLMADQGIGKFIVPIVPDEARTFGMEGLFRQFGIYAHKGQLYEPVDKKLLLYYKEAKDGQILEEGITEAGAMSSFIAAGTAYATHGINTIPFFIYYSMFGFQRIGDLIWANADIMGRGFLLGATAGRTTLSGEGLQHEDGHSHVIASTVPNIQPYDPAFAYEVAVIIQDGIKRMYQDKENVFYYLTLYNEKYDQPAMPAGVRDGILKGLYKFRAAPEPKKGPRLHLFGSGSILPQALKAQELLAEKFGVQADVWSATSYTLLRRDALDCERWNMLHPTEKPKVPYLTRVLADEPFPVVAVSDYMKVMADQVGPWTPAGLKALGTDGFGRSESRENLRRFFEIDPECTCVAALYELAKRKQVPMAKVAEAIKTLGVDPDKVNPAYS